jgi:predicted amidohydrolase
MCTYCEQRYSGLNFLYKLKYFDFFEIGGDTLKDIVNKLKIASIQMNCELGIKEKNLAKAISLIKEAAKKGAKMIAVPELFNTGYRVEERDVDLAEAVPGPTTEFLEKLAKQLDVYIIGAILENSVSKGVVYDTAFIVGPEGYIGNYRKIHLWDTENARFTKGDEYPVFETRYGKIGIQICYEVGFPEGARILTQKGADIIFYPSAFGETRLYAWDIATRSRALENGVYVIAANRTGTEKEETVFGGNSRIVHPNGSVLIEAVTEDDVIITEIDLEQVVKQRRMIPYLRDFEKGIISKEYKNFYKQ